MLLEKGVYLLCTRDRACRYEACTHDRVPHFPLHDSILLEGFDRTASFFNGFSHQLFAPGLFESPRENLSFGFSGYDQDPIHVAKENISGTNTHRSDLYRNAEVDHFVAWGCVLSVGAETESREAHIQNGLGISHVAVQHRAPAAQLAGSCAHEFSPQRVSWRGASVDVDFVTAKIIE